MIIEGERWRRGAPCEPPQKTLKNCHKNAKKTTKLETPWIFSQPHVPTQKNLKMTVQHLDRTLKFV
jgi:hypothetical protein